MASTRLRLSISVLVFLININFQSCAALYPTQLIYEFPNPTLVKNLAIRADDSILTTLALGWDGKRDTPFVTTAGRLSFPVNGNEVVGGQLVAVELGEKY